MIKHPEYFFGCFFIGCEIKMDAGKSYLYLIPSLDHSDILTRKYDSNCYSGIGNNFSFFLFRQTAD